ncbi:MAG TPA: 3-deoxy-8-phosphooctulonate synthase [Rhabdochlamydiaceae bacterium]|nr:3-deoxy-8-phosphooctulonate synthase [Rhabdochlamydiaceae bacterium]
MKSLKVKDFLIGKNSPFALISGPCVIESEEITFQVAESLKEICASLGINLIFKSSYDKANRLSVNSYRGPGIENGLKILEKVKDLFDLPIFTDVHTPEEAKAAGEVCDILQIPAFLCRQTDLVLAAGGTGRIINLKKGQFMAPWDMRNLIDKVLSTGNDNILLTDRGTSFGYNNLVSDMRAIPIMQKMGFPVCFDGAHSVQLPGGGGNISGGQREFIPTLCKAAIAAGCNCIYIETHPDPLSAKSDPHSQFALDELKPLLQQLKAIYEVVNQVQSPCCTAEPH